MSPISQYVPLLRHYHKATIMDKKNKPRSPYQTLVFKVNPALVFPLHYRVVETVERLSIGRYANKYVHTS